MKSEHDLRVENEINASVRKLYAEGFTPDEMKAAIDRIVADVTDRTTRQLYVQARQS
jgi:hypothetical protein